MGKCKFGVVVFPGSNCDRDVVTVTRGLLDCPTRLIWHQDTDLSDVDVVVLPGGFSYGDYLRCGAIAHFSQAMQSVKAFADKGGYVIGICNGWQILLESGLLPGALVRNKDLKFICDRVGLTLQRGGLPWTGEYTVGEVVTMPIAHGEGSYYCDSDTLKRLEDNNQVVWRYCDSGNGIANPNGSVGSIAGICNPVGNVLGMMPHPERAAETLLNVGEPGQCDGLPLWKGIAASVEAGVKLAAV